MFFILKLFKSLPDLSHTITEDPLPVAFITIVLSAAKALNSSHSSPDRLLCMGLFILFGKSSPFSRLKNTSKLAWPFHTQGLKADVLLKFSDTLLQKCHLHRILRENYTKFYLSSGSFMYIPH